MMNQRIELLRKFKKLSRRKLEDLTGIKDYTWQAVEIGKQMVTEEHIKAISTISPEYKYWIVFGETMPSEGQISPEIEEERKGGKENE